MQTHHPLRAIIKTTEAVVTVPLLNRHGGREIQLGTMPTAACPVLILCSRIRDDP